MPLLGIQIRRTDNGRKSIDVCVLRSRIPAGNPSMGQQGVDRPYPRVPKAPDAEGRGGHSAFALCLGRMVGSSEKAELEQMELAVRVIPAPEADRIANLNAIHALLATLPNHCK